jgi:dTDP-4-dehydrorhamnose reductase
MTNTPRILVVGRTGQVGYELRRCLGPVASVTNVDFPEIDLTRPDSIRPVIREARPAVIINAAAYTAVDKAETEIAKATAINAEAPAVMAEEARELGALLVHYSTDYVFDGTATQPYVETDTPNPLGAYGRSKLAGDQAVAAAGADHLIFRLCWVYGARGANFMLTMMRLARERELIRVVADQHGCPTWSRMIAEATGHAVRLALAKTNRQSLNGTYHLAAAGQTTWHGFASAIIGQMAPETRKCTQVEPITTADYPTPARRPAYSVLNCDKLENTFGLRLPAWDTSLRDVCEP